MKLKYYMRGIGLGLVLSVLLYSMVIIPKYKMTDDEVMERAKELGMSMPEGEDVDLSALTGTPAPEGETTPEPGTPEPSRPEAPSRPEGPSGIPEPAKPDISAPSALPDPPVSPAGPAQAVDSGMEATQPPGAVKPGEPTQPAATVPQEPTKAAVADGKVSITVVLGMNSDEFAGMVQKAGLVEDAKDFDEYLMANGYAKELRAGTYRIAVGATYQEIAERVTAK